MLLAEGGCRVASDRPRLEGLGDRQGPVDELLVRGKHGDLDLVAREIAQGEHEFEAGNAAADDEHLPALGCGIEGHDGGGDPTKKKELVCEYKNGGRDWRPRGDPIAVNVHDFPDKTLGKTIPYGIYDIGANNGSVNVGITKETAAFAVASIRSWWKQLGCARYPDATTLQITADCEGGNGNHTRLWKTELQRLADETGLQISVCHFPPGTSKWNKIEHRLELCLVSRKTVSLARPAKAASARVSDGTRTRDRRDHNPSVVHPQPAAPTDVSRRCAVATSGRFRALTNSTAHNCFPIASRRRRQSAQTSLGKRRSEEAGYGNRTRLSSLGSWRSTDELIPRGRGF